MRRNSPLVASMVLLVAVALPVRGQVICQQITDTSSGDSAGPSLSGGAIAFKADADPLGTNGDGTREIFPWDGMVLAQITDSTLNVEGFGPASLSGGSIAFPFRGDPLGTIRTATRRSSSGMG